MFYVTRMLTKRTGLDENDGQSEVKGANACTQIDVTNGSDLELFMVARDLFPFFPRTLIGVQSMAPVLQERRRK